MLQMRIDLSLLLSVCSPLHQVLGLNQGEFFFLLTPNREKNKNKEDPILLKILPDYNNIKG